MSDLPEWDEVFTVTGRKEIGGGKHTNPAEQFTWTGVVNGRSVEIVSTVRTLNPEVSFMTSSNARQHYTPDYYHAIELSAKDDLTQDEQTAILAMADAADERPVFWRS